MNPQCLLLIHTITTSPSRINKVYSANSKMNSINVARTLGEITSYCNHLPGCFPWVSQDPCIFRIYFRISFVHPATQTGAISNQLTALDCPNFNSFKPRLSRKIPKTFQGLLRCLFFVTNLAKQTPPSPPKIKINMSPEKEFISKGIIRPTIIFQWTCWFLGGVSA